MKSNRSLNKVFFKTLLLLTSFLLAILVNKSKAAASLPVANTAAAKVSVDFKHDAEKDELKIRVKTLVDNSMQFFLFTPDGILVQEVPVSAHKTTTVKGLKKGFYLYECFNQDERLKSGSLVIK